MNFLYKRLVTFIKSEAFNQGSSIPRPRRSLRAHSMNPERLNILYVSQMPTSPPRFGAQARMHGLMTELARRHDLTAVMLVDDEFDIEECRLAMQVYCREVALIPNPYGRNGLAKRL